MSHANKLCVVSAQTSATPNATSNTNATVSKPALNLSTSGAFNGTGIALLDLGIGSVDLFFYYQHYTGQIRASELRSNVWRQGQNNNIVVTSNVKNGTPISAVAYTKDAVTTVRKTQDQSC